MIVVFDLDGTLIGSVGDLAAAASELLSDANATVPRLRPAR